MSPSLSCDKHLLTVHAADKAIDLIKACVLEVPLNFPIFPLVLFAHSTIILTSN